jgi:hypothetical protein
MVWAEAVNRHYQGKCGVSSGTQHAEKWAVKVEVWYISTSFEEKQNQCSRPTFNLYYDTRDWWRG